MTGLRVVMETADHMTIDEDYLTRDEFSLHKMIIAVTRVGKVLFTFGCDILLNCKNILRSQQLQVCPATHWPYRLTMHYDALDEFNNKARRRVSLNDFLCELHGVLSHT